MRTKKNFKGKLVNALTSEHGATVRVMVEDPQDRGRMVDFHIPNWRLERMLKDSGRIRQSA